MKLLKIHEPYYSYITSYFFFNKLHQFSPFRFLSEMSEDELVAQCILFFLVGYGTTAATLTFMAYSLAVNPECQQKLIAEVDEIFEKEVTI